MEQIVEQETPKTATDLVLEKIQNKEQLTSEDLSQIKKLYLNYSNDILETVGKGWFTAAKASQKMHASLMDIQVLLEQLIYFELCVCKKEKGYDYYKIDINKDDLKTILQNEIDKTKMQLLHLETRLAKLNNK